MIIIFIVIIVVVVVVVACRLEGYQVTNPLSSRSHKCDADILLKCFVGFKRSAFQKI